MHAPAFASLAVCVLTLAYLAFCFFSSPVEVENKEQLISIAENAIVLVHSDVFDEVGVRCSADCDSIMRNRTFEVIGYRRHYLDDIWVQALKVVYDS